MDADMRLYIDGYGRKMFGRRENYHRYLMPGETTTFRRRWEVLERNRHPGSDAQYGLHKKQWWIIGLSVIPHVAMRSTAKWGDI